MLALFSFVDREEIAAWAKDAEAQALPAGIIHGTSQYLQFIN
jgi:hypothetical protein